MQSVHTSIVRSLALPRDGHPKSKANFHSAIRRASQSWKSSGGGMLRIEDLRIMFVRQIIDPAEDRHVRINFVFGGKVHEVIILNVEVPLAEIQLFPRIHPLRGKSRAQFLPPKIGT